MLFNVERRVGREEGKGCKVDRSRRTRPCKLMESCQIFKETQSIYGITIEL